MTPAELRDWREQMGWSTADAARSLGVAVRTYRYYEDRREITSSGAEAPMVPLSIALAALMLRFVRDTEKSRRVNRKTLTFIERVKREIRARCG